MKRINFLLFNDRIEYEMKCRGIIVDSYTRPCRSKWWMITTYDRFSKKYSKYPSLTKAFDDKKLVMDALVRREEHGRLWSEMHNWREIVEFCYSKNILPMSYDFGYFDHYQTYMVDVYNNDGTSNITTDWNNLSDTVNWDEFPEYIKTYRNKFLKKINKYKKLKPISGLEEQKYVVIWPQGFLHLLKPQFKNEKSTDETQVSDWINKLCEIVLDNGLIPVVKGNAGTWKRMKLENIKYATVYASFLHQLKNFPTAKYEEDINHKLISHAKYHITACSSVTNEIILADAPVITMGKSWFTGLDIFNEPTSWDNLIDNPMYINQKNRNKWINWWITRQVPKEDVTCKFKEIYDKYSKISK